MKHPINAGYFQMSNLRVKPYTWQGAFFIPLPFRVREPPETSNEFFAFVPLDLFAFFSSGCHNGGTFILYQLLGGKPFKELVVIEMLCHPHVEVLDVGDGVRDSAWFENVGVFRCKGWSAKHGKDLILGWYGQEGTYEIILALCFRALKCGSGKQKNILASCPF